MGKTLGNKAASIPLIAMVALNPLRWNLGLLVDLNFDKFAVENFSGILAEMSSSSGVSN